MLQSLDINSLNYYRSGEVKAYLLRHHMISTVTLITKVSTGNLVANLVPALEHMHEYMHIAIISYQSIRYK